MAEHDAADETDLYLNVESPTSSPVLTQPHDGPSTPPRNGYRIARPLTPHESPRDLSALFAAVSPGKFPWANQDTGYEGEGSTGGSGSRQRKVPRPGGMRRMLTKTQSLGAVPDSPSEVVTPSTVCEDDVNPFDRLDPGPSTPSRSLGKTRSLPESPSKTSLTNGASLLVAAPLSSEQNDSGGRAKRTYGRSRTILAESSTTAGVAEEVAGTYAMDNALAKESYAVLRKKFEVDNTESREDESRSGNLMSELLLARAPQPVSDMRSKGENRRFLDELGYLIDGIADPAQSIGLKRASSLDVLRDMQNVYWISKMKICGQSERIWCAFMSARGEGDEIMDTVCLAFLATLIQSGSGLDVLLQTHAQECIRVVTKMLKIRDGALDEKSGGKVKTAEQKVRQKVRNALDGLRVPSSFPFSSTRRTASFILNSICQDLHWHLIVPSLSSEKALTRVLKSYTIEVRYLIDRLDLYEKGLDLMPAQDGVDLDHMHYSLQILSAIILNSPEDRITMAEDHIGFSEALLATILVAVPMALTSEKAIAQLASRCVAECLQLLANLANLSIDWASTMLTFNGAVSGLARVMLRRYEISTERSEDDCVQMKIDSEDHLSDDGGKKSEHLEPSYRHTVVTAEELLCLILAIVTASVLANGGVTNIIAVTKIDEGCSGVHACLRSCHCFDASPLPVHLIQLYLQMMNNTDESSTSIITGYLALLLSRILTGTPASHDLIIPYLPGETLTDKLEGLLSNMCALSGLQSVFHRKLGEVTPWKVPDEEGAIEAVEAEVLGNADVLECAMDELRSFRDELRAHTT